MATLYFEFCCNVYLAAALTTTEEIRAFFLKEKEEKSLVSVLRDGFELQRQDGSDPEY